MGVGLVSIGLGGWVCKRWEGWEEGDSLGERWLLVGRRRK